MLSSIQLMLDFFKTLFLILHLSYYKFNELPDDFICNIAIYADGITLCVKCNQASDLW